MPNGKEVFDRVLEAFSRNQEVDLSDEEAAAFSKHVNETEAGQALAKVREALDRGQNPGYHEARDRLLAGREPRKRLPCSPR